MFTLQQNCYLLSRTFCHHNGFFPFQLSSGPSRKVSIAGNQPGAPLVSEVGPGPLDQDKYAVTEPDQEEYVHKKPCQPGEVSRDVQFSKLSDRRCAPNSGKAAFIKVVEIFSRRVPQIATNDLCHITSFLQCNRRDAWQQIPMLIFQVRKIANDEYVGIVGNAQVSIHHHTAGTISGSSELFAERRSGYAGRPQDHRGWNSFSSDPNCTGFNLGNHRGSAHLYA